MKNLAIHHALRLKECPEEMAWLCFPNSELPEGITELLRLCNSKKQLEEFAQIHGLSSDTLRKSLLNFVEKVMVVDGNSDEKILGVKAVNISSAGYIESEKIVKQHYQLLMRIFHPDINPNPETTKFATLITNAYTHLKQKRADHKEHITVSEYRKPPKSFYSATQKTEMHISHTKSAMAIISAITLFTLVAMVGYFYDPAKSELITTDIEESSQKRGATEQSNSIRKAAISTTVDISDKKLQAMLKKLEDAYENGRIDIIKPILANTPEIKNQTDQQLNDKLETLFEITSERKMVLFNFDWKNISSGIQGQGKFLSRYHLNGEEKWLTREGIATITLLKNGNKLSINQLELKNSSIEQ